MLRRLRSWRRASVALLVGVSVASVRFDGSFAAMPSIPSAHAEPGPTIVLDRLDLAPEAKPHEKFLRKVLRREAANQDWGAGASSTIEFRFSVHKLSITRKRDVLTLDCSAFGRLPRGRTARSQLTFSGDPKQERQLIQRVLTIVVQGVLTRLSDIERERREHE